MCIRDRLNSKSKLFPQGLGNRFDQVGRNLQGHHYTGAIGYFDIETYDDVGPGATIAISDYNHGTPGLCGGGMLANEFIRLPIHSVDRLPTNTPRWGLSLIHISWYWKTIHENILSLGFDALWADETEPDLPPNGAYFHIGPGTQFFNVYPLFHTAALYDGFRKDEPNKRALILSRDAYLGAQRNGAIFWSSDIYPTWDTLRRQIPTGLDFAASGLT